MAERAGGGVLSLFVWMACLFLLGPVVIVCVLAFGGSGYLHFPPSSYSLRWFQAFFGDARWQQSLLTSTLIALVACAIATGIGFLASYGLVRGRTRLNKPILSLMLTPIVVPTVITAIAMYFLTAKVGLIGNVLWIGASHAVVALPIVLVILVASLQGVDINLERAALSLGASRARVFFRIVLPLSLPGILSAALFAFLASFDELVISLFLAGVRAQTLPVRIWNSLHMEIEPVVAAAAAFLIGVTGLVLLVDAALRRSRPNAAVTR